MVSMEFSCYSDTIWIGLVLFSQYYYVMKYIPPLRK